MWRRLRTLEVQVADLHTFAPVPPPRVIEEPLPGPSVRDRTDEVMAAAIKDPIDLIMAEATVVEPETGSCHLVLGDSMARDWRLVVDDPDVIVNKATGGNTYRRLAATAEEKIKEWRQHCTSTGQRRGTIIIWCGGNDVYGGRGLRKEDVRRVLRACGEDTVLLLGPTPRTKGREADKSGINWRSTSAYFAEATIAAAVADAGLPMSASSDTWGGSCVSAAGRRSAVGRGCLPPTASTSRPPDIDASL